MIRVPSHEFHDIFRVERIHSRPKLFLNALISGIVAENKGRRSAGGSFENFHNKAGACWKGGWRRGGGGGVGEVEEGRVGPILFYYER